MINKNIIANMLEIPLKVGAEFSEVFLEHRNTISLSLQNGKVERANSGIDSGLGLRIISGERVIYAYTNDLSEKSLIKLAGETAQAVELGEASQIKPFMNRDFVNIHKALVLPFGASRSVLCDKLKSGCQAALSYNNRVTEVSAGLSSYEQDVFIYNSEGLEVSDKRVRTRLTVNAVAGDGVEKQTGYFGPGAMKGIEFAEGYDFDSLALMAAESAVKMLSAGYAPSGRFPVIIDNGFGGVLFHEACGHGLEAIAVAKKTSVFADKLGEKIASEKVTAIDDGTLPSMWGSENIDDEGEYSTKNVLIENGILKNYMTDRYYGKKLGIKSTGACRRQSYMLSPVPRMTNTYIAGGNDSRDDIISSVDYGIYCKRMGGGSVSPATGEFNFAVDEAYIIRNGKIAEPVRGASLIGRGNEILKEIEMVSPDMSLACGMCGASSGSIPVMVGQPMIKVKEMTVGGKA